MAAPLAATYVPAAADLPAWLSYTSLPTATAVIPYTVATLLPNGVPTLLVSAAEVTQYETAVLQLPLTVDANAVSGQDLGNLYTTAGGEEPSVLRELGGTRAFTLASATQALAATGSGAAETQGVRDNTARPEDTTGGASASSADATRQAVLSASSAASLASSASASSASLPSSSSTFSSATAASSTSSASPPLASPSSSTNAVDPPSSASPSRSLHSLSPSELAAAIAAPLCIFFAVIAAFALFICCSRRRRRKRAAAAALAPEEGEDGAGFGSGGIAGAEEQGLLGFYGATGPTRTLSSRRDKRKNVWEWVPPRFASPTPPLPRDGRNSRASGRVMALLSGGKLGAAAEKERPQTAPEMREKGGFGAWDGSSAGPPLAGGAASALFVARGQSRGSNYSIVQDEEDDGEGELQDVDLTSPRVHDTGGAFSPIPQQDEDEDADHFLAPPVPDVASAPMLPPVDEDGGRLRLSRYYTPPDELASRPTSAASQHQPAPVAHDPFSPSTGSYNPSSTSSPSSYESPPLRTPPPPVPLALPPFGLVDGGRGVIEAATRSLGELRDGYASGSDTEGEGGPLGGFSGRKKRDTRLGYLDGRRAGGQLEEAEQLTPPATPQIRLIPGSTSPVQRARQGQPVVSEMGWLSGRLGFLGPGRTRRSSEDARRASDEEERLGASSEGSADSRGSRRTVESSTFGEQSAGQLFLNSPRWLGAPVRRSPSPPPFSRLAPAPSAYDHPSAGLAPPLPQRTSDSSSLINSLSAYGDPPHSVLRTPSLRALPDSPLMHPSPARPPAAPRNQQRQSEGGLSTMNRIAASFTSVGSGLASVAGLGIEDKGRYSDPFEHTSQVSAAQDSAAGSVVWDPRRLELGVGMPEQRGSSTRLDVEGL
ncbi:hypothetical protein JCM10213v2_002574 [Rhodosporidiobolus nylandii]